MAWTIIIALIVWVWVAVGWWLSIHLWQKENFIPYGVKATALIAILVFCWAAFLFLCLLYWARYNYRRYYLNNKRKIEAMALNAPCITWAEAVMNASNEEVQIIYVRDRSEFIN